MVIGGFGFFNRIVKDVPIAMLGDLGMKHDKHILKSFDGGWVIRCAFSARTGAYLMMNTLSFSGKGLLTSIGPIVLNSFRIIPCPFLFTGRFNALKSGGFAFAYAFISVMFKYLTFCKRTVATARSYVRQR